MAPDRLRVSAEDQFSADLRRQWYQLHQECFHILIVAQLVYLVLS